MESWWQELTPLNKAFAGSALFFSMLMVWQLVTAVVGLGDHAHFDSVDSTPGHDFPHGEQSGHPDSGQTTFALLSVRSLVAFGTLFSWAGSLYLMRGTHVALALLYSLVWGAGALYLVAYLMYRLLRLQEVGNFSLWSAVGRKGTVYLNVPPGGVGKVRVMVGGTVSFVNARSTAGRMLHAGSTITVIDVCDNHTLLIKPTEESESG
jgi:membrane protein implicated in regulation of membrane protease activity